jgi:hypothetical protein
VPQAVKASIATNTVAQVAILLISRRITFIVFYQSNLNQNY